MVLKICPKTHVWKNGFGAISFQPNWEELFPTLHHQVWHNWSQYSIFGQTTKNFVHTAKGAEIRPNEQKNMFIRVPRYIYIFLYMAVYIQGGPLPVINSIITPRSKIIIPVTQLRGAIYRTYKTHIYNDRRGPPCTSIHLYMICKPHDPSDVVFLAQLEDPDWKHAVSIFMGLLGDPWWGWGMVSGGEVGSQWFGDQNILETIWKIKTKFGKNLQGIMLNMQGFFHFQSLGLSWRKKTQSSRS